MSDSEISHTINSCLGSSNTCTGKIAGIFAAVAAFAFTCALSSAIASAGIYFFDYGSEAECSATALSSFSTTSFLVGAVSSTAAISIRNGLCGNYDVCGSSTSSTSPSDVIIMPNPHKISSNSSCNTSPRISPPYSINSSDLPSESTSFQYYPSSNSSRNKTHIRLI